jgi:hypothetical protein
MNANHSMPQDIFHKATGEVIMTTHIETVHFTKVTLNSF